MIEIVVPGKPVAKGRPRATMIRGYPHIYTPALSRKTEKLIEEAAAQAVTGSPLEGPLDVRIVAFFQVAKSLSKRRQAELLGQPHTARPDADNVAKLYTDAINGIAYRDDSQIAALTCRKWWSDTPRTVIKIHPIGAIGMEV